MKKLLSRMPLYPGGSLVCYPILLFAAFLLAQGIKTPVTHMLFWAVLLIPLGVIIELIIIRVSIRADMRVSDTVCGKHEPVRVSIIAANRGLIPIPYVRAEILCTDPMGNAYTRKNLFMSLLPFSVYRPEESMEFDFRGEYSIETDSIIVSDLFRMVYMRVPCKFRETVTVLPRRVTLPPREEYLTGYSQNTAAAETRTLGDDGEFTDNREYRNGDSPKRIHWKLSSKSEELTVRDLSGDNYGGVYILCDMFPPFGGEQPVYASCPEYSDTANLACIDAVTENAIAAAARELECGGWAEVCWFEYGEPAAMRVQTGDDLERLAMRMGALRPDRTGGQPVRLAAEICRQGLPVVIVSPRFDKEAVNSYAEMTAYEHVELIVCSDRELFADGSREAHEYALAGQRLAERGITAHFVSGMLSAVGNTR